VKAQKCEARYAQVDTLICHIILTGGHRFPDSPREIIQFDRPPGATCQIAFIMRFPESLFLNRSIQSRSICNHFAFHFHSNAGANYQADQMAYKLAWIHSLVSFTFPVIIRDVSKKFVNHSRQRVRCFLNQNQSPRLKQTPPVEAQQLNHRQKIVMAGSSTLCRKDLPRKRSFLLAVSNNVTFSRP